MNKRTFATLFETAVTLTAVVALPLFAAKPVRRDKGNEHAMIAAMKFVTVLGGTFWMGGGSAGPPMKQVEIKQAFQIAAYVVTQYQWQTVMGSNPSYFRRDGGGKNKVKGISDIDLGHFPVDDISWHDAQEFLIKLNRMQESKGWLYRMPTEAEWEYACRGAPATREECCFDFYLDKPRNDLSSWQANIDGRPHRGNAEKGPTLGRPARVGSYPPNRLGLYDMHGNVYQWCSDLWDSTSTKRVARGGSWNLNARDCRAAERRQSVPSLDPNRPLRGITGLRLVRVPATTKQ